MNEKERNDMMTTGNIIKASVASICRIVDTPGVKISPRFAEGKIFIKATGEKEDLCKIALGKIASLVTGEPYGTSHDNGSIVKEEETGDSISEIFTSQIPLTYILTISVDEG